MKIENKVQLQSAFQQLDLLIANGFEGNVEKEADFFKIAKAIEYYEDKVLKLMPMQPPKEFAKIRD